MRKLLIAATTLVSLNAMADGNIVYNCTLGKATRTISVVYDVPGKTAPCIVNYTNAGETKTLWNYPNNKGQCEKAAEDFATKQKGWGWICETGATPVAMPSPTPPAAP